MLINITAAVNSGNETVFNVVDSEGIPVDLTMLNATVVTVSVCGQLICGSVQIDSDSDNVSFENDIIRVKFGKLNLTPSPQPYYPKISYITATDSEPEVIVGKGYFTEIKLKVIC